LSNCSFCRSKRQHIKTWTPDKTLVAQNTVQLKSTRNNLKSSGVATEEGTHGGTCLLQVRSSRDTGIVKIWRKNLAGRGVGTVTWDTTFFYYYLKRTDQSDTIANTLQGRFTQPKCHVTPARCDFDAARDKQTWGHVCLSHAASKSQRATMKSHAATLSRVRVARQNRRCDMALTISFRDHTVRCRGQQISADERHHEIPGGLYIMQVIRFDPLCFTCSNVMINRKNAGILFMYRVASVWWCYDERTW